MFNFYLIFRFIVNTFISNEPLPAYETYINNIINGTVQRGVSDSHRVFNIINL